MTSQGWLCYINATITNVHAAHSWSNLGRTKVVDACSFLWWGSWPLGRCSNRLEIIRGFADSRMIPEIEQRCLKLYACSWPQRHDNAVALLLLLKPCGVDKISKHLHINTTSMQGMFWNSKKLHGS